MTFRDQPTMAAVDDDDDDSLYSDGPLPAPLAKLEETVLDDETSQQLDDVLDEEELQYDEEGSGEGSVVVLEDDDVPAAPVIEELEDVVKEEDDWFDSDEQKEVESLASSDDSIPSVVQEVKNGFRANTVIGGEKEGGRNEKRGGFSLLTRASQTFYKAFKKGTKKGSASNARKEGEEGVDVEMVYKRLDQLLEAQIATLNGAKTGFVDLRLLQPMTEKTVEAIEGDAKMLLGDFGRVEKRARELEEEVRMSRKEAEGELEGKEQILIAAKVKLAEAAAEVDELRHELKGVQRELGKPERVERRMKEQRKRAGERLKMEARAVGEAREEVEKRLGDRRKSLGRERQEVERLESGYRDMEGDWAL